MEPNPPKNSFNLFYSNRVNARGRALNAAMSSLHSFDRSLDKFMAWLSDTESALESLELELDSYGPGVKTSRERVLMQLKVGISSVTQHQFRTSSTVIEWINNWRHISLIVSRWFSRMCLYEGNRNERVKGLLESDVKNDMGNLVKASWGFFLSSQLLVLFGRNKKIK